MKTLAKRLQDFEERFWGFVETCADDEVGERGCWLWRGYVRPDGAAVMPDPYGHRGIDAHTVAYLLANGVDLKTSRKGFVVVHTCGTSLCVCPDHLVARKTVQLTKLGRPSQRKPGAWELTIVTVEHMRALKRQAEAQRDAEIVQDYVFMGRPMRRVMEQHGVDFETFCRVIESRGYRRIPRWRVEDPEALRDWRSVPAWAMLGDDYSLTE